MEEREFTVTVQASYSVMAVDEGAALDAALVASVGTGELLSTQITPGHRHG